MSRQPKLVQLGFRVEAEQRSKLKAIAASQNTTVSELVRPLVEAVIEKSKTPAA